MDSRDRILDRVHSRYRQIVGREVYETSSSVEIVNGDIHLKRQIA